MTYPYIAIFHFKYVETQKLKKIVTNTFYFVMETVQNLINVTAWKPREARGLRP